MKYNAVLVPESYRFLSRQSRRGMRRLLSALDTVAAAPHEGARFGAKDSVGHNLLVTEAEGFAITYGVDEPVANVVVLEIVSLD